MTVTVTRMSGMPNKKRGADPVPAAAGGSVQEQAEGGGWPQQGSGRRRARRPGLRTLALGLAASVVAVAAGGCGGDDDDAAATGSGDEPAGTTEATGDGGCREIEHEGGTTCVPADPQRIVALDSLTVLPTLIELDAPVVGALSVYSAGDPFPDYLDPVDVEGIEVVGDLQTPNVEAILAAEPDLII